MVDIQHIECTINRKGLQIAEISLSVKIIGVKESNSAVKFSLETHK